jgi:hypothetical protein
LTAAPPLTQAATTRLARARTLARRRRLPLDAQNLADERAQLLALAATPA